MTDQDRLRAAAVATADALRAEPGEVERLREALRQIAADRFGVPWDHQGRVSLERRDIARAALAASGEAGK